MTEEEIASQRRKELIRGLESESWLSRTPGWKLALIGFAVWIGIFTVGTRMGWIEKSSVEYSSDYSEDYEYDDAREMIRRR